MTVAKQVNGQQVLPGDVQNFITISAQQAKLLRDMYDLLVRIDYDWAGVPEFSQNLAQSDLDLVSSFNGIDLATVAGGQSALSNVKNILANELNQLQAYYSKILGTL